jgi:lipoprotein-releasing system permease protein
LNTAFEIAKRISFYKQKNYTRFIVRLSIAATAISVAAILLTFSIVNGFQTEISQKIYSFWGQVQISAVSGSTLENKPEVVQQIKSLPTVQKVAAYLNQPMVLAKELEIEGLNAKGIEDVTATPQVSEGRRLSNNPQSIVKEIMVSKTIAQKLQIKLGDQVRLYFFQNGQAQERKLTVVGLFNTGIEEYDSKNVFVDLKLLQQLIQSPNTITGHQIYLNELGNMPQTLSDLQAMLPENWVSSASADVYPQLFDWIEVQQINRNITIIILLFIAIVNLMTCLLILLLERIPMIGTLTAMGASQNMIRKVFVYQASFIAWVGIGLGVFIGLGLSFLQLKYQWVRLDESAYLMDSVPIRIQVDQVIGIIIGTAVVSYISFLIPTIWIKKISPAKAVRFD